MRWAELTALKWRRRTARRRAQSPLKELLTHPLAPDCLEDPNRLVALDLEMTGLDPARDSIIALGWVVIEDGAIDLGSAFSRHVSSRAGVGQSAVIHGLRDCDLLEADEIEPALEELVEVLKGSTLLCHSTLDLAFLDRAFQRHWSAPLTMPLIDTLAVERRRLERRGQPIGQGDLTLAAIRERYGLPAHHAHDALDDAIATAELWLAMSACI